MKLKGLIAAAGRSSRMDGFKPLMKLNGFPMIQMTIQSLRNGGIEDITVVTGCRAKEMAEVLQPLHVRIIENTAYAKTDMLTSVKMGLCQIIEDADGVCFLPGDVPLTSAESMKRIKEKLFKLPKETQVLQPILKIPAMCEAHPPVLLPESYENILAYKGEGGLRGAFSNMRAEQVELWDDGVLLDADYRADFEWMEAYAREHKGVSWEICKELYQEAELPVHIQEHCKAVGNLAGWIAERLTAHGACLDIELCRSGGYLHDLCRQKEEHERAAGIFLRERGFLALAQIVEQHKGFRVEPDSICQEAVIVCLADKLILENKRVSLKTRYQKAFTKTPIKERIIRDIQILQKLMEEFEVITGEQL